MKRIQCRRCINDSTVNHISFDSEGICNFCRSYETIEYRIHNYEDLEQQFLRRIHREKGKHRYDVAMGLSGGKDSAYVLYKLVRDYGLNVKAFTLNNGFLSDSARKIIEIIVKELGVDHEYVECEEELLKPMYHYIVSRYISPCIACSYLGYAAMINYASKVDAAIGMHGRSTPQMFRNYTLEGFDPFQPFIEAGLKDTEQTNLEDLYEDAIGKIRKLVDKNLAKAIEDSILSDARNKGYREFVAYFLYHPYDKEEILCYLNENTAWNGIEEEHFDCRIHNGAMYLKNIIARRPHTMNELSVSVRENRITREEAMALLKQENVEYPEEEIRLLCDYANLNRKWLLFKAKLYGKRWW